MPTLSSAQQEFIKQTQPKSLLEKTKQFFTKRPAIKSVAGKGLRKTAALGKGVGKLGLAIAPVAAGVSALADPEGFKTRAQESQLISPTQGGLRNVLGGAGQFLADTGNIATFGLAGKLGESIANKIGGGVFETDVTASERQRLADLRATSPTATEAEILNPANIPFEGAPEQNPNARALVGGTVAPVGTTIPEGADFVAPVGLGSRNPFGRTQENQAQIDARVAGIDAQTAALREAGIGRQGGRGGLSPEQAEIIRLAGQLRGGNIGDKQRNAVINQRIAALQGVDTSQVSRGTTAATLAGKQADIQAKAQAASLKDISELTELAQTPEGQEQLSSIQASRQASDLESPATRSLLKQGLARTGTGVIDAISGFLSGAEGADPSTASFKGYELVKGGGFAGGLVGLGPGIKVPGGTTYRQEDMSPAQWRTLVTAVNRDN